ncbi:MAG: ATP-binding protein [Saprospiraceae bacterium]|nr:ATP-binding protein [Saprospiraceae bacterium]
MPPVIRNLRFFYIIAIATVALMLILNQWVAAGLLRKQEADSQVVNIAGRQRMLSQRLSKLALKFQPGMADEPFRSWEKEFSESLSFFRSSHRLLQEGNEEWGPYSRPSQTVQAMFQELDRHYLPLVVALISFGEKAGLRGNTDAELAQVMRYEQAFLNGMDAIVFRYAAESKTKISLMQRWETGLLVLALEVAFIFRPLFVKLEHSLRRNTTYENELLRIAEVNRIAKEEAEAESRTKSDLLANISQEIRTPMNGVMGMAELMAYTPLNRQQREYLHVIRAGADNLHKFINDLLDYAGLEAGSLRLEIHAYPLRLLVEETLDLLSQKASDKNLDILYHWDERIPEMVRLDSTRLRQILLNLVSNAVKFTQEGAVAVHVEQLADTENHVQVLFRVKDSGIGLNPEKQNTLHQIFTEKYPKGPIRPEGIGLGLLISSRMLKVMGGELRAVSETGRGSDFHFILSLEKDGAAQTAAQKQAPCLLSGKTMLVIDDNEANRHMLEGLGRLWGMNTLAVNCGKEAHALLGKLDKGPDLALVDMDLPDTDGVALHRALSAKALFKNTKFVLLTTSAFANRAGTAQFHAVVSKPVKHLGLKSELIGLLSGGGGAVTDEVMQ